MRIRKAAEVQSSITALVTSNPNTTYTIADLAQKVRLQHPEVFDHHVTAAVGSLLKVRLLQRVRSGSGKSRYLYELHPSRKPKDKSYDPNKYEAPLKFRDEAPTDVQVTIDKATGGLQISYKGIQLTINIKE